MLCEIQLTLFLHITKCCTCFVTLINYVGYNYLVIRHYTLQANKIKLGRDFYIILWRLPDTQTCTAILGFADALKVAEPFRNTLLCLVLLDSLTYITPNNDIKCTTSWPMLSDFECLNYTRFLWKETQKKQHVIGLYLLQKKCAKVQSATWIETNNCGEQSPYDSRSAILVVLCLQCKPEIYCRAQTASYWTLSWANCIQSATPYSISFNNIYICNLPVSDPGNQVTTMTPP
jgi:hypothetical protein